MKALFRTIIIILSVIFCIMILACDDDKTVTSEEATFPYNQYLVTVRRTNWHTASKPTQVLSTTREGQMLWHNPALRIPFEEIYDAEAKVGEDIVTVFRIIHRPLRYLEPDSVMASWSGIMAYIGDDVYSNQSEYFEIRARGGCELNVELGNISEDLDGDELADTEDTDMNGTLSAEEDIGLDGMSDAEERIFYNDPDNPDPSGDNFYFFGNGVCPVAADSCAVLNDLNYHDFLDDPIYYEWLNGTEGNREDPATLNQPDKENISGIFNLTNAYNTFTVDLSDTMNSYFINGSEKYSPGTFYPWRTYRISFRGGPIDDTARVNFIRVWVGSNADQTTPDTAEVAFWYFVKPGF